MSKNKNNKKTPKIVKRGKSKKAVVRRKPSVRNAVSAISTAPVAIGNSIRGATMQTIQTGNGVVCRGRDFMFTPIGSGIITTWTLVGGTPVSPIAFVDSNIRTYLQRYQKFRWRRLVVHYITSSPTSSTGDVMFYHGKNRDSVFLNQTSSNLLQFVMADRNTVIGPQWTNHSAELTLKSTWKSTDYGMSDDPNEYSDGEVFLLSKTTTTDSPGYVLFDYEIEFAQEAISPRLLNIPMGRAQWFQTQIGITTTAVTATVTLFVGNPTGNNLTGGAAVMPAGAIAGDVYKIIFDVTNSSSGLWVNVTPSNLMTIKLGGTSSAEGITVSDGFTCYAVYDGTGLRAFGTCTAAYAGNPDIAFATTATITYNLQCWLSLVGTISAQSFLPSF